MTVQEILLTGGTGSLGSSVLNQLLAQGYKVNAVIRSIKKSQPALEEKYASHVANKTLVFTEIPDLVVPHVFDKPASTADAIIHVATPLVPHNFETTMIQPTWQIDDNILTAATKSTSVKRVIISGSIVSTVKVPEGMFREGILTENDWNPTTHEEGLESMMRAYQVSKTNAEKKTWEFMKTKKPNFDLVVLLAPSITGKSTQHGYIPTKDALGGMANIYRSLFDVSEPGFVFPSFMDVEDVATIHVRALDPKVPGNERYLFESADQMSGPKLTAKIREVFPQLRDRVPAPKDDSDGIPSPLLKRDTSKADRVFGPKTQWKDAWSSARGTVEDVINLEKRN